MAGRHSCTIMRFLQFLYRSQSSTTWFFFFFFFDKLWFSVRIKDPWTRIKDPWFVQPQTSCNSNAEISSVKKNRMKVPLRLCTRTGARLDQPSPATDEDALPWFRRMKIISRLTGRPCQILTYVKKCAELDARLILRSNTKCRPFNSKHLLSISNN